MKLPKMPDLTRLLPGGGGLLLNYGDKYIYTGIEGDEILEEEFEKDTPSFIARFSTVEYTTVREFKRNKRNSKIDIFSEHQRYSMSNNAGFFPVTNKALTRFACELIDLTYRIDVLACWHRKFEDIICKDYLPQHSKLIHLCNINPLTSAKPWTRNLKGKKVLVIYPYADTIKKQYERRELLHKNKDILPEFELITMKPVQSIGENKIAYNYESWFDALKDMKKQIKTIDFDIALIGAGAYGLFLADYCKSLGKKAVHMGGDTQLLFGIKGKRWDDYGFYNEYWVRPSEEEKPLGAEKVEGGCYW